jgi:hypothetical protein
MDTVEQFQSCGAILGCLIGADFGWKQCQKSVHSLANPLNVLCRVSLEKCSFRCANCFHSSAEFQ